MIKRIKLKNFKCFQESPTFEFSKLNLLTGINGRGKSSVLQSVLLLGQTLLYNSDFSELQINGENLHLGNFNDIKCSDAVKSDLVIFEFDISTKDENDEVVDLKATFEYNEDFEEPLVGRLERLSVISNKPEYNFEHDEETHILTQYEDYKLLTEPLYPLHYVSADRLGPVMFVEKTKIPEFITVGSRGENTINILANYNRFNEIPEVLYLGKDSSNLLRQTAEWLNYILNGAKIGISGLNPESSILYMLLNNKAGTKMYKPANVGFGYSYILPLIVSGLIAEEGEIVIVENPEAHLHPKAQARIAEFFAKVASNGVQVFIESHSEHILNGLRVSALRNDINISTDEISVLYFNESFNPEKLHIKSDGKIDNWPEGFFDQQEIDLTTIFTLSNNNQ
ncbi:MAG: DUF3696 domain-containing protein [Sediminibacterium sp.]|nr:DUF3696 domain-containing protein [Sediminibacterium sp.]